METRVLGRTGRPGSVIGPGHLAAGADWGEVDAADACAVLETSLEAGVTFYDTADFYVTGMALRTGEHRFELDPADGLGVGFVLR